MSNTVATDTIRTMDRHEAGAARTAHPPRPPHPPHPPSEAIAALEHRAPRTTLIDRIAMRIGGSKVSLSWEVLPPAGWWPPTLRDR